MQKPKLDLRAKVAKSVMHMRVIHLAIRLFSQQWGKGQGWFTI